MSDKPHKSSNIPKKLKLNSSGHIKSPWSTLAIFIGLEILLLLVALILCTFIIGWRSPQNALGFAVIALLFVNIIGILTYPLTRSMLGNPLGKWFSEIRRKAPKEDFNKLLTTAHELKQQKKYSDAYRLYQKALTIEPDNASLLIEVAQFTEQNFSEKLALKYYKRLVELGQLYVDKNILLNAQKRLKEIETYIHDKIHQ